jgi:DNA repair exonuclease SbcCD ATPase subunit
MSEKLLTPLEVMPPALRHLVETILKKHQRTSQSPLIANSTKLGKQLAVLESLWAELQWQPFVSDLQQRTQSLAQRKAKRPMIVQQQLPKLRQKYARRLEKRKQKLAAKRQRWEQKKQKWRSSLQASKRVLAEKSEQLTWPSTRLIEQQLLSYENEWRSAEQRIEEQSKLLRQAESSYDTSLRQKKETLTNAFKALKHNLNEKQQQAPELLTKLRQQNAQSRSALPALVATWKSAAIERETRLHDELEAWNKKHPILSAAVPSWNALKTSSQELSDYEQSLSDWNQQLQQRRKALARAEQNMLTEWQRVNAKPSLSGLHSAEQKTDWLKKSLPLRLIWRELFPLMKRCALLKAELLTSGFLAADEYPEVDIEWANC